MRKNIRLRSTLRVPIFLMIGIIPAGSKSGLACISYLQLSSSKYPIRAIFRTPQDVSGVEKITGVDAMKRSTLAGVFKGINSAMIVTPHNKAGFTNDAEMTCNMIEEAAAQGVKHVVLVGSWTVNKPKELSHLSSRFLASEAKLKEMEAKKGLQWTVLRGGYFLENWLQAWAPQISAGKDVMSTQMHLAPVSVEDIGRCAAVCLSEGPAEHHGKCYEMTGPEVLSIQEIGEEIAKATGTNFKVNITPADKVRGPPYLKELSAFLEKNGESAAPFSDDIDALIGKNTTVFEWALANSKYFSK